MSRVLAYSDIRARMTGIGYPMKLPNTLFTLPLDAQGTPLTYMVLEIMGGTSRPITIGDNTVWENVGTTWIHILTPVDSGPDAAFALGDEVTARIRFGSSPDIVYLDISDDPGSEGDDNGNYWRTSISTSWRFRTIVQGS
jgi:hypothetical protein